MEINDYDYKTSPVKKTRQYEVHALSPDGVNQYLNKESYLHNFLNSPSALYKNNFKEHEGIDFNENYKLQMPLAGDEKYYHKKRDVISLNRDTLQKRVCNRNSQSQIAEKENIMLPKKENYSIPEQQNLDIMKKKNFYENN